MASAKEIRGAVSEVKENLVLNNYKVAMMTMAQISIELIEHLIDENLIVSKGYEEDLKTLLNNNIIDPKLERNFETMIISGVQAHNGVEIPKEHAEKAFEVLNAMIDTLLVEKEEKENITEISKEKNQGPRVFEYNEEEENENSERPAFLNSGDSDVDFREREKKRQDYIQNSMKKTKKRRVNIIAIVLPIFIVFFIAFLIKGCLNGGEDDYEYDYETESYVNEGPGVTLEEETTETETETETTISEAGYYRVTADVLNVRSEANSNATVIERLETGRVVQVIRFVDNVWALIRINGRDAFVARDYLRRDETQELAPEYNEE